MFNVTMRLLATNKKSWRLGVLVVKNFMKVPQSLKNREIIIEFFHVGHIVKVTAMDAASLTEISIQGPKDAGEETLKFNALRRLEYVLRKKGIIY